MRSDDIAPRRRRTWWLGAPRACSWLALILSVPSLGFAQAGTPVVLCVDRARTEPPPPPPSLPAGKPATDAPHPAIAPRCPSGKVPRISSTRSTRIIMGKGNPLIPQFVPIGSPTGEDSAARGIEVRSHLLPLIKTDTGLVVGHDTVRRGAAPPMPPGCGGVPNPDGCYYYATMLASAHSVGAGMLTIVERPLIDDSGGPSHSLNEISVQGGPQNGNIVEIGWNVSTSQYGDPDPHLFVYHWKKWAPTCYDACNWQQWSATYFPGMSLKTLVDHVIDLGYTQYNGNWWVWFNGQWIGYFPRSEWPDGYQEASLVQWFGEVATQNGLAPKTTMGNGFFPVDPRAATMSGYCLIDATTHSCTSPAVTTSITNARFYDLHADSARAPRARYGGPGSATPTTP